MIRQDLQHMYLKKDEFCRNKRYDYCTSIGFSVESTLTLPILLFSENRENSKSALWQHSVCDYFSKYKYVWLTGHSAWPFFYLAGTVHVNGHQYKRQDVNMPCSETFGNYKEKKVGSDTCRLSKWNGQLNRLLTGYKKEKWHYLSTRCQSNPK